MTGQQQETFRKLYGRLPQDINGSGHDEAELNTNGQSAQDEDNEEDDIEQYDEENEQANDNVEPRMARPERERQPPVWLRDYET